MVPTMFTECEGTAVSLVWSDDAIDRTEGASYWSHHNNACESMVGVSETAMSSACVRDEA